MSMPQQLDIMAKPTDEVEVEILPQVSNPAERTVYVHVNGITVLRIGHIPTSQLRQKGTHVPGGRSVGFNPDDTTRET